MKTYQLKFLAWTFSAFLPPDDDDATDGQTTMEAVQCRHVDCYDLLDVRRNANADDIKKAYKKRSLQLHPDKVRQRGMKFEGQVITEEEARARFQQMKSAYDVLNDPKKRKVYDVLGHRGMDFVNNPSHAWDPQILLGNLAKSSVIDRAKLMTLILVFFGLILLQPILVCAKVDQMLEMNGGALINSSWVAIFIPFWFFATFYGVLLVIGRAKLPLLQLISFVMGVLFLALKFDNVLVWNYAAIFAPFYVWLFLRLVEANLDIKSIRAQMSKMVTIEFIEKYVINEKKQDEAGNDIEDQLHRTYNDLNEEERDNINKEYVIVHVPPRTTAPGEDGNAEEDDFERIERSPEYREAKAQHQMASKSIQRIFLPDVPLIVLTIVQLDMQKDWNWGLVFLPVWLAMIFECCGGCYGFFCTSALAHIEVQEALAGHIAKKQEAQEKKSGEGISAGDDQAVNGEACEVEGTESSSSSLFASINGDMPANVETNGLKVESTTLLGELSTPPPEQMSVKQLRDAIKKSGLTEQAKGMTEKSELVNLLKNSTAAETSTADVATNAAEMKTKIDTAVSVVPTTMNAAKSNGNEETKEPQGEEDDDNEFMFEMDEDTFNFYQQAEAEAENTAVEAQSKAVGSFCNLIFQAIITSLFVAKLNQVYEERDEDGEDSAGTSSFSSFWILFPFFFLSGIIICCFSCAIFGASAVDSAMSPEEEGAGEDAANDAGGVDVQAGSVDDQNGTKTSPIIPMQPVPFADTDSKQKDDDQPSTQVSTESSSKRVENVGNGTSDTDAPSTAGDSAMDDLD